MEIRETIRIEGSPFPKTLPLPLGLLRRTFAQHGFQFEDMGNDRMTMLTEGKCRPNPGRCLGSPGKVPFTHVHVSHPHASLPAVSSRTAAPAAREESGEWRKEMRDD